MDQVLRLYTIDLHIYSFLSTLYEAESPLGTDTCNTISVIGSDYLIATPSTSQSDEKSSHERSESPNFAPPHLQVVSVSEPDENEIGKTSFLLW